MNTYIGTKFCCNLLLIFIHLKAGFGVNRAVAIS